MAEGFREKTPEELRSQVEQVSEELGQEIIQPTSKEAVFGMSLEEIKEKFPVRYEMYLKMLQAQKNGSEISAEEKEEMQEWLAVLNNLDKYIENHKTGEDVTLRERQITVFEDMRDFLEGGGTEGYIKLPTGAGKTVIFSEFIEAIGLRTLIVVPTRILVGQTEEKLEEFAEDLDVGKIYTNAKNQGENVTIITYQSLVKGLENGTLNPDDYKCLILDEAHTALSDKRIEAVGKFTKAIKLGFIATPKYSEDKNVGQLLNTEIHSLGVKEAAEEGAISPFSVILVETNTDLSDVSIKKNGEYSDEELERAINIESRNRAAVQLYKQMFNGKLATVYCSSIDHAKNVMKLFLDEGVPAAVIYGQQTDKEQEDILEKFSTGEIKVLCNARILIPGFDEEGASVCLNLDPSMSAVDVEQRAGRVLRLNKHDKDKHATIVDFIDKNNNKKVQPITFAEIAGASVVYKKSSGKRGEGSGEGDGAPRPIPDIAIEGLKVTTDSEEVMRVVSKMIEEKAEKAPAGWMTENRLGKELARNPFYLRKVAGRYREENPDWFRDFIDSQGVLREHFSPDLVGIIKEILGSQEKPPAGWVHMRDLAKKLNSGYARIFNAVAQYRESHPEWFKEYLGRNGVMVEHYSPELVLKIEEALGGLEIAPEGWMVANNIARELHSSFIRVTSIADGYRINHPEWFKEYLDKKNRVGEHYSSELVLEIEKVLSSQEKVPDGWETLGFLSKQLLVSERKVKNITNKYVADHPEWFKKYVSKTGQLREYYSPELIDVIREQIALEIEPPAGWVIAKKLALEFSRGTPSIQRIADQFREGHPEWFKEYLSSNNQMIEHYSPELILEIKKILETQEKPPAGWLVRKNLSDELNQHLRKIDAIANKYRTSHPEWFHEYLDKREHMREHFSPELVEKIKEELENK